MSYGVKIVIPTDQPAEGLEACHALLVMLYDAFSLMNDDGFSAKGMEGLSDLTHGLAEAVGQSAGIVQAMTMELRQTREGAPVPRRVIGSNVTVEEIHRAMAAAGAEAPAAPKLTEAAPRDRAAKPARRAKAA